jgi:hypothetical protein
MVFAVAAVGCGDMGGGPATGGNSGSGANVTVDDASTVYRSPGDTAGISVTTRAGVIVLDSFDPGVFVTAGSGADDDAIDPAQFDGTDGADVFVDDGAGDDGTGKPPDDGSEGDGTEDKGDGIDTQDDSAGDSFDDFPTDFEYSDGFNDFVEGLLDGSLDFIDFPFDEFFEDFDLTDVFPDVQPPPDDFGDFKLGERPESVDGFPDFPDIPGISTEFASWFDDDIEVMPENAPDSLLNYDASRNELAAYIENEGITGYPNYYDVADLVPDGFLSPEQVADWLEDFGADTPMIGQGSTVNPELEQAFADFPPVPDGFEGFAFQGDFAEFDDLFTQYDQAAVGDGRTLQVNSTFNIDIGAGIVVSGSQTTLIEVVLSEATPLVEMSQDVYQTQWVVNIRQATNVDYSAFNSVAPDETEEGSVFVETISQMSWTVVLQEMDTDADNRPDEMWVVGTGTLEVLDSTVEGPALVEMIGESLLGPAVIPPFRFEAVLAVDQN